MPTDRHPFGAGGAHVAPRLAAGPVVAAGRGSRLCPTGPRRGGEASGDAQDVGVTNQYQQRA
jgi:hypothetical protein